MSYAAAAAAVVAIVSGSTVPPSWCCCRVVRLLTCHKRRCLVGQWPGRRRRLWYWFFSLHPPTEALDNHWPVRGVTIHAPVLHLSVQSASCPAVSTVQLSHWWWCVWKTSLLSCCHRRYNDVEAHRSSVVKLNNHQFHYSFVCALHREGLRVWQNVEGLLLICLKVGFYLALSLVNRRDKNLLKRACSPELNCWIIYTSGFPNRSLFVS